MAHTDSLNPKWLKIFNGLQWEVAANTHTHIYRTKPILYVTIVVLRYSPFTLCLVSNVSTVVRRTEVKVSHSYSESLICWLFGFNGISNFVGYLTPNPFLWKLFYFKQFSSVYVSSSNVSTVQLWKTFLFQTIQFCQAVLIQFSISTDFVYTQLNVKTVLYYTNQFSVSTLSMSKNSSISNNSV